MTTPTSASHDDEHETLYWLQIARRVLAGDIAPQEARAALHAREAVIGSPRAARRPSSRRALPTRH